MFAPAYVGRKRRAKPLQSFYSFSENIRRLHNRPTYAGANMGHPDWSVWSYESSSHADSSARTLQQHECFCTTPKGLPSRAKPLRNLIEREVRGLSPTLIPPQL